MPNNFTYTLNIPNPPNNPSVDVPNMQINTNSTSSLLNVDHVGFNTNGSGIHKQVTLLNEAAPGLGDGNGVLYAGLINGQSWPIWQNALGSTSIISRNVVALANGYTSLPGGILLQWGSIASAGTSGIITFPIAFPNNAFTVTTSYNRASTTSAHTVYTTSLSTANFTYAGDSSTITNLYWIAIGN